MQYLKTNLIVVFLLANISGSLAFGNKSSPQIRKLLSNLLDMQRMLPHNTLGHYVAGTELNSEDSAQIPEIIAGRIPLGEGKFEELLATLSTPRSQEKYHRGHLIAAHRRAIREWEDHKKQKIRMMINYGIEEETFARDLIMSKYPPFAKYLANKMADRGCTPKILADKLNVKIQEDRERSTHWYEGHKFVTTEEVRGWLDGSEVLPPSTSPRTRKLHKFLSKIFDMDQMVMAVSTDISWEKENPGSIHNVEWMIWQERFRKGKWF